MFKQFLKLLPMVCFSALCTFPIPANTTCELIDEGGLLESANWTSQLLYMFLGYK